MWGLKIWWRWLSLLTSALRSQIVHRLNTPSSLRFTRLVALPHGELEVRLVEMEDTEMKVTMSGGASKVTHISTKGWTLENVLTRGSNFLPIPTVDVTSLQAAEIERLVQKHENSGIPLLMTGFHRRPFWDSHKFSPEWLKDVEGASRTYSLY
jgi:hypothetical protein